MNVNNFDELLDALDTPVTKAERDAYPCQCPKHNPRPRPSVSLDWRDRFKTADWDPFAAMAANGIPSLDTPQLDDGESADEIEATEGRSNQDGIWLRKDARYPRRTAAHELAHVLLNHGPDRLLMLARATLAGLGGAGENLTLAVSRARAEQEAESVAVLVAAALGYPDKGFDVDHARHYIAGYLPPARIRKEMAEHVGGDLFALSGARRDRLKVVALKILTDGYTPRAALAA